MALTFVYCLRVGRCFLQSVSSSFILITYSHGRNQYQQHKGMTIELIIFHLGYFSPAAVNVTLLCMVWPLVLQCNFEADAMSYITRDAQTFHLWHFRNVFQCSTCELYTWYYNSNKPFTTVRAMMPNCQNDMGDWQVQTWMSCTLHIDCIQFFLTTFLILFICCPYAQWL